jgi:hypothetical protein
MNRFVSDSQCNELAEILLQWFEVGNLHSQSSTKEVAKVAKELLVDDGLPTRWSLACVIARKAQAAWHHQILQTKKG